MKESKTIIRWHRLLARMFEELLTPFDITVLSDFPIMSNPPEADILLIRREGPHWTEEQLLRLPDGIRDTDADHLLIEFKYTESVSKSAVNQALAYDTFFRNSQQSLTSGQVQTFLLSSKTPSKTTRRSLGYTETLKPGVYGSTNYLLEGLYLIVINELSRSPHNEFVKCFASRKKERKEAFRNLIQSGNQRVPVRLLYFLGGILRTFFKTERGEIIMEREVTPDFVMEIGKDMYEAILSGLRPEDFLERFDPEEILSSFKPEEILSRFKPEEIENYLKKIKK